MVVGGDWTRVVSTHYNTQRMCHRSCTETYILLPTNAAPIDPIKMSLKTTYAIRPPQALRPSVLQAETNRTPGARPPTLTAELRAEPHSAPGSLHLALFACVLELILACLSHACERPLQWACGAPNATSPLVCVRNRQQSFGTD